MDSAGSSQPGELAFLEICLVIKREPAGGFEPPTY